EHGAPDNTRSPLLPSFGLSLETLDITHSVHASEMIIKPFKLRDLIYDRFAMPRQKQTVENLLLLGKIRERGCSSPTSSSSSVLREGYRFKRAITTHVPTWRLMGRSQSPSLRDAAASPCGSKTLWEMNEVPSPRVVEEESVVKGSRKSRKESVRVPIPPPRSVRSGSLPAHLSDPSHSPVSESERMEGTGSRQRKGSSTAQKLRLGDCNVEAKNHVSNGSFMDIETRSRAVTPTGTTMGVKTRLKECSNALTTSKELLKIINRMWGQETRPSSSTSLVSALHSELERARLQVNQLIHEHNKQENNDVTYLMKRFAKEWKSNEQQVVEAAIESVAGELEAERKLRRRSERLNKKLGKELAETKAALMKVKEEVEKEREMLQLADALREERVQMKLSEYMNHHVEEDGEVEDEHEEEYDLHSIELNIDKSYKWPYGECKSLSLQRSVSDCVDWVVQSGKLQKSGEGYLDDTQGYKPNKASSKDQHLLSGPR
ncbi:unnamed protein product, partial [Brassica oleracea var. botrytis]